MSDEKLTYLADVEVIADSCETMLKNSKIFEDIAQGNPTLAQKIKDKLKNFIARLKQLLNKTNALTHEGKLLEECVTEFENINRIWDKAVTDGIKTANAMHAERKNNTDTEDGVQYLARDNNTSIKQQLIDNLDSLNSMDIVVSYDVNYRFNGLQETKQWAVDQLKKENGIVSREGFGNVVLDKKRIKKGLSYLKTPEEVASFIAVPDIIRYGVEIDRHDKHKGRVYDTVTFAGPVEMNGQRGNVAVVIRIEENNYYKVHRIISTSGSQFVFKTEKDIAETAGGVNENSGLSPTDNVSTNIISSSAEKVNKDTTKFSMRDTEYLEAVKNNDMETAQRLVDEAAKKAGYSSNSDYQGTSAFNGSAPSRNGYFETKEDRLLAWENDEFEDTQTLGDFSKDSIDINNLDFFLNDGRAYRNTDIMRKQAILNLKNTVNGNKDTITMYRSVPNNVKESKFRNGDWITPSRLYAVDNARVHGWGEDYRIIEQEVSIEDVWWDGNDIAEWGYDNGNDNEIYKNTENNVKLATVTYDDDGNVIPLSERFNEDNNDIRYQSRNTEADIDYSDLTTLDDEEIKVYNKRGWTRELFTAEDKLLLEEHYNLLLKNNNSSTYRFSDGSILTEVNNKMVVISGRKENPVIEAVIVINAKKEYEAEWIKELIYDEQRKFRYSKEDFSENMEFCEHSYAKELFKTYISNDYRYRKGYKRNFRRATLPSDFKSYGYTQQFHVGEGDNRETEQGISKNGVNDNIEYQQRYVEPATTSLKTGDGSMS